MSQNFKPKTRSGEIMVQDLIDEVLIYDAVTNKAFCLNETSALIWNECDGKKTIEEIAGSLSKKLNDKISTEFVFLALDQLRQENLLNDESFDLTEFAGMSRREVIKKVGLASAVALPVVASLVSPVAAQAASVCLQDNEICPNGAADVCCNAPAGIECQNAGTFFFCATAI